MVVRGAPAMGQAAAIGLALTAQGMAGSTPFVRRAAIRGSGTALINARPTAANVRWAVERCFAAMDAVGDIDAEGQVIADAIRKEAEDIVREAAEDHERLATLGLASSRRPRTGRSRCSPTAIPDRSPAASSGPPSASSRSPSTRAAQVHVFVDETRPYLQGARLTAWELGQAGVGHTLIADAAAGWVFTKYAVDAVLVGADRIAANGDTANKIGTYPLAVLARAPRHPVLRLRAPGERRPRDARRRRPSPSSSATAREVTSVRGPASPRPGRRPSTRRSTLPRHDLDQRRS